MQRFLDFVFASVGLFLLSPILFAVYCLGLCDTGAPVFRQKRLGRNQRVFTLYKFRTMRPETPDLPSHLADSKAITAFGKILRVTKMDELLQLINVIRGEMSIVGPRPNLVDQVELIECREKLGVYSVRPGITGLAQIKGIDMSTPELLAKTDKMMIDNMSLLMYFYYVFRTAAGSGRGDAATR